MNASRPNNCPASRATVWVDADACHVRAEIIRVCRRYGVRPRFVANKVPTGLARRDDVECIVAGNSFDAADDYIVGHLSAGDLVLTGDIVLAARVVKAGGFALDFRGRWFSEEKVGELLAMRDLKRALRTNGRLSEAASGPRASDHAARAQLLQELNNFLNRAVAKRTSRGAT